MMSVKNFQFKRGKLLSTLCYIALFSVISASFAYVPDNLYIAKIIVGILAFFLIPGVLLSKFLRFNNGLGLNLIIGFLIQLINVFILYFGSKLVGPILFYPSIVLLTVIWIVLLSFVGGDDIKAILNKEQISCFIKRLDRYLILSIILYLVLALYFQQFAVQPNSDGAIYLSTARNVVEKGVFQANTLALQNNWDNVQYITGFTPHMFAYFGFSLFFMFGGISLGVAKAGLIFLGLLIVIITYVLSESLFNKQTARIASFIVSTSAIFVTTIGLVGGPEAISILFTLFSFFLVIQGIKTERIGLGILAGLSLFVVWQAWDFNFYTFVGLILVIIAFYSVHKKESFKLNVSLAILLFAAFFIDYRLTSNITLELFGYPFPLLSIVLIPLAYLLSVKKSLNIGKLVVLILSLLVCLNFAILAFVLTSPESLTFQSTLLAGVSNANLASNVGLFSRVLSLTDISYFSNSYTTGLFLSIGSVTVFLAISSLIRLEKIRETIMVISFPFFNWGLWSLLNTNAFQPRYIFGVSVFYAILVASTITCIVQRLSLGVPEKKIFVTIKKPLFIGKMNLKKLIAFFAIMLMLGSLFLFNYSTFDKGKQTANNWDLKSMFGWQPAIDWINKNTAVNDKVACIYGDYFSWYTDRQTAFLYNYSNKTSAGLIELIQSLKINYLVVDKPFRDTFLDLAGLYDSKPFLGSSVVFSNEMPSVKVVVYNVTNIAYGRLAVNSFEPNWCVAENWQALSYYGISNATVEDNAIRIDSWPIEQSPTAATITLNLGLTNLTGYNSFDFYLKAPKCDRLILEVYSGNLGQNYFSYRYIVSGSQNWTNIHILLPEYTGLIGNPDLGKAVKINFIIAGVNANQQQVFWIKDIVFSNEAYVL
jgi:hypothetical protein